MQLYCPEMPPHTPPGHAAFVSQAPERETGPCPRLEASVSGSAASRRENTQGCFLFSSDTDFCSFSRCRGTHPFTRKRSQPAESSPLRAPTSHRSRETPTDIAGLEACSCFLERLVSAMTDGKLKQAGHGSPGPSPLPGGRRSGSLPVRRRGASAPIAGWTPRCRHRPLPRWSPVPPFSVSRSGAFDLPGTTSCLSVLSVKWGQRCLSLFPSFPPSAHTVPVKMPRHPRRLLSFLLL